MYRLISSFHDSQCLERRNVANNLSLMETVEGPNWRKCWKGFYIARSKDDSDKMAEYASRIRKLQQEIGIPATDFDNDILPRQDTNETRANSCRFVYSKKSEQSS